MNCNLKMTVERSKRRSYFLSLVFITKCFSKNLLLRSYSTNSKRKIITVEHPALSYRSTFEEALAEAAA